MLQYVVTYTDFDGIKQEKILWFHLTKASLMLTEQKIYNEVIELSQRLKEKLPLFEKMKDAPEETDPLSENGELFLEVARIMTQMLDKITDLAYGNRSGNDRFQRTPQIIQDFKDSLAYETFVIELLTEPEKLLNFIEMLTSQIKS